MTAKTKENIQRIYSVNTCIFIFFCKAASNVGPYGLFWQPALVRYSSILYLCVY